MIPVAEAAAPVLAGGGSGNLAAALAEVEFLAGASSAVVPAERLEGTALDAGEVLPKELIPTGPSHGDGHEAVENYGFFDPTQPVVSSVTNTLQQLGQKLGQFLIDALEDASTLKVTTYVSTEMDQVEMDGGKLTGAQMRALTYIKMDGDTMVCVPERDGAVDTELWNIHVEMVKQAQAGRTELIKAAVAAAAGLVNLGGSK